MGMCWGTSRTVFIWVSIIVSISAKSIDRKKLVQELLQELGLDDDVTKDVRVDEMPGADRVIDSMDQESDSLPDEIRRHPEKYGMKVNENNELTFNGEVVKSVSPVGGDDPPENRHSYNDDEEEMDDLPLKYVDGNRVEKAEEISAMEEIKRMLPVKSIQEIKSIDEIKNIEEIDDEVAEQFIREENLRGHGPGSYAAEEAELETEIEKEEEIIDVLEEGIEKEEEKIDVLSEVESVHEAYRDSAASELEGLKRAIEAKLNEEVENIEEIKSMEEVKTITPIKSIKEVKNIYELTDSEAADLREMIKNYKEGVEDSRRRRRRRRRRYRE